MNRFMMKKVVKKMKSMYIVATAGLLFNFGT